MNSTGNPYFTRQNNEAGESELRVEDAPLSKLAERYGTPAYIYSKGAITDAYQSFSEAFATLPHQICVSVKACSNLSILSELAQLGAGFDVVSGGELERVVAAGGDPRKTVFAGVGKTDQEIVYALELGIQLFNVESTAELYRIDELARARSLRAPVALRINPDVDAKTHAHINTGKDEHKFGIPLTQALDLYRHRENFEGVELLGLDCHIGSLITDLAVFELAFKKLAEVVGEIRSLGAELRYLDIGGGLGVSYTDAPGPSLEHYAAIVRKTIGSLGTTILFEPGRWIFANAALLLSKVLYTKETQTKRFVILDSGFNDLLRPILYSAYHEIEPVTLESGAEYEPTDIVGPVCETGDCFAKARPLPPLKSGDLVAIRSTGAYGFTMASNYNTRPRPPEILVEGTGSRVVRPRESVRELFQSELECLTE